MHLHYTRLVKANRKKHMQAIFWRINKVKIIDTRRLKKGYGKKVISVEEALNFEKNFWMKTIRENRENHSKTSEQPSPEPIKELSPVDLKRKELGFGVKVEELEIADPVILELFAAATKDRLVQPRIEPSARVRAFKRGKPSPYKEPQIPEEIEFPVRVKTEQDV